MHLATSVRPAPTRPEIPRISPFFSTKLTQPIASLTVQVYTYAISPYEDWHRQAWAGALVLVGIVLICSILARLATRRLEGMARS